MVQEELVYGDGWISDESSFYGKSFILCFIPNMAGCLDLT
jgi:hypothetical protein